uniref:Uncharacterized protein n=1 Tax=Phlebia radiata TaxID=5308 RepID=L8B9H7_PHLRA|nr:hypothetical protein Pra_mt0303 [Phlebia radiata]CCF07371.1 hypothetical protein Pra_mt0303 [Phlebia radiata]
MNNLNVKSLLSYIKIGVLLVKDQIALCSSECRLAQAAPSEPNFPNWGLFSAIILGSLVL